MQYSTDNMLQEIQNLMLEFVPNYVEGLKPKREEQVRTAFSDLYKWHLEIRVLAKNIEIDHLLGCNDVIINQLVIDWSILQSAASHLKNELEKLKQFKDIPAVKGFLDKYDSALKPKTFDDSLVSDLKEVSEAFDITIDIKELLKSPIRISATDEYWKSRK